MANQETRLRLEMNLNDAANAIDIMNPVAEWIDDPEWEAFSRAWFALIDYVSGQGETVLGHLTLMSFVDFARLLRKALLSGELNPEQSERVEEELISLEGHADELVRELATNLRYQRPDLDI